MLQIKSDGKNYLVAFRSSQQLLLHKIINPSDIPVLNIFTMSEDIVSPEECQAMISFNNASDGLDAEELAKFFTKNTILTF